jgi:serine/threonine protein phosphatase PrpC
MSTKISDCGVCFTHHISNVSDIRCLSILYYVFNENNIFTFFVVFDGIFPTTRTVMWLTKHLIENIKKYTSELQAFLDLKQIQRISMKNETCIQSLVEDGNFKETKLSFKVDDQICNLFNNVNSFGEISIATKSSDVNIVTWISWSNVNCKTHWSIFV